MINLIKYLWNKYTFIRFIFIGIVTVIIDFIFYIFLILLGINTEISKGVSFILGTIFSYFANKTVTFKSNDSSIIKFILFIFLYLSSMTINVTLNGLLLNYLDFTKSGYFIAFIAATIISACINFVGMKFIIFYEK